MNILENTLAIELASVLAGPSVGQFLSELGVKVIKVENPENGDITRTWKLSSEKESGDISTYFATVNWGKKSLLLNLKDKNDLKQLYQLITKADFIIASFKPGDAKKLGVDYKTLIGINPKLIYAAITGFGEDVKRVGYDAIIQAESGFMSMNGTKESSPLKMPVALMDILAAHQLKEAILCAYIHRLKTGEGNYVSVSLLDAAISSLANQANNYLMGGKVPKQMGNEHPNIFPYGSIFNSKDEVGVLLAIGNDRQFQSLCKILKVDALAKDERFSTNSFRVENRETLRPLLKEAFKKYEIIFLTTQFLEANIPFGRINSLDTVFKCYPSKNLVLENEDIKGLRQKAFTILNGNDALTLSNPYSLKQNVKNI